MYASIQNKSRSAELYFIVTDESWGGGKGARPQASDTFIYKMKPKPPKAFRIMTTHPNCADRGATDQGSRESHEVTRGHNPFFANNSR